MGGGLGQSADSYLVALKGLLPYGPAWESDDNFMYQMLDLAAREFARVDQAIIELIEESDPRTASYTLEDWFADWGIPDDCLRLYSDLDWEQYRKVLVAKIATLGYPFEQLVQIIAQALGFSGVTLGKYKLHTVESVVDDELTDQQWQYYFTVTTDDLPVDYFLAKDRALKPLAQWGHALFECLVKSLSPCAYNPVFQYGEYSGE